MKYFCPEMMSGNPEETDKETFLKILLERRPKYAIVWDVHWQDILEFKKRVWVVDYVAISNDSVYYSGKIHYAKRARKIADVGNLIEVESDDQWEKYLPKTEQSSFR